METLRDLTEPLLRTDEGKKQSRNLPEILPNFAGNFRENAQIFEISPPLKRKEVREERERESDERERRD
eukprot:1342973-Amorphochlora_amoeboformis.AAC.1